jgi:uncharacterized protein YbbC (DUF1343 family)
MNLKMRVPQVRNFVPLIWIVLTVLFTIPIERVSAQIFSRVEVALKTDADVELGAERSSEYLPLLKGKRVGVVANHTSLIGKTHLVDTLRSMKVNVVRVFAPEHGFRGSADAGEKVNSSIDEKTKLPLVSLYGKNKKPSAEQLAGLDVIVFDIQDVGVRFYTYISTMSYVMEACAEAKIPVIVLDRPNPNGHYVDGPILKPEFSSFVGLHPVPVVHGLTVGEYAQMVNGEGWLKGEIKCNLTVVSCKGWQRNEYYQLTVPPSPNLQTMNSIYLYPSLCFFEGTIVSIGRGTPNPFEMIGYPNCPEGTYSFTPKSGPGSKSPMYENIECRGFDLRHFGDNFVRDTGMLYLYWISALSEAEKKNPAFFTSFFDKLAGTDDLRKQLLTGTSEANIRKSWAPGILQFKQMRKKYLIYADF